MKNVGRRRVVDDDYLVQLSAEAAEVFDVVSAVEDARLAEEPRVENVPLVQQIGHGVRVLQSRNRVIIKSDQQYVSTTLSLIHICVFIEQQKC